MVIDQTSMVEVSSRDAHGTEPVSKDFDVNGPVQEESPVAPIEAGPTTMPEI